MNENKKNEYQTNNISQNDGNWTAKIKTPNQNNTFQTSSSNNIVSVQFNSLSAILKAK